MQVQTSAVVLSSPGEDQERKIDTCALGSGSGPRSEMEPKKDTSTTTAHSTELPTTDATMSRGGVEPMSSGSARKREWTETLPEEENPSGEETSVNEEDEQAMTRGGVEPMYSGSAPKCQWTETLPEEEDRSGEERSVNEEEEQAMTRGGAEPMYSGSAPKCQWTEILPEEEDPSGEETSVNEEEEQAMTRGGAEPMYSGSAPKCQWTETLPEEEDPSGEETSDHEYKEATTAGEDTSSEEDEEATTSGGVKPIYSGTAPKSYWTQTLPAKEEDASGVETSVNEEDEKGCLRLVRRIYPSELKLVRKIAQGGQAKIFLAKYLKTQQDVVVKRYTSCQVKAGKLQRQMERVMKACEKRYESGLCGVIGVSVDEKGRVSTVMELMDGDLRNFIDVCNPLLSYGDKLGLMKAIASGIKELHGCGFIHKDLKASNILVSSKLYTETYNHDAYEEKTTYWRSIHKDFKHSTIRVSPIPTMEFETRVKDWKRISSSVNYWNGRNGRKLCCGNLIDAKIGDYESSDVVLGTGFFRAPEVLRALRDGTKVEYSAAVDVYGFGMVCYELLTGNLPFQGHPLSDYDLVLSGERPDVSNELPWMRNLLHRCWHEDPHQRPGWDEILQILM
jgi:serine/threonine protein kinase